MAAKQMSCLLIGEGALLVQCGDALIARGHRVHAVVSASSAVQTWAKDNDLFLLERGEATDRLLEAEQFDWLFSIANLKMLPESIWSRAKCGAANFHDGPLPLFAGLNAPAWAIMAGATRFGVVWHQITEGADEGDILASADVEISDEDTSLSLNTKCFAAGIATFSQLLDDIENDSVAPVRQDLSKRTYFGRHARPKGGAVLDFNQPADAAVRLARALDFGQGYANPLGLTKISTASGIINVGSVRVGTSTRTGAPGEILSISGDGMTVACASGAVMLGDLSDVRGRRIAPATLGQVGQILPRFGDDDRDAVDQQTAKLVKSDVKFESLISAFEGFTLPNLQPATGDEPGAVAVEALSVAAEKARLVAAYMAALSKLSGQEHIGVALETDASRETSQRWPGLFAPDVPFSIDIEGTRSVADLSVAVERQMSEVEALGSYAGDLISRTPELGEKSFVVAVRHAARTEEAGPTRVLACGTALTLELDPDGDQHSIVVDTSRFEDGDAADLSKRLVRMMTHAIHHPDIRVCDLSLVDGDEFEELIYAKNDTACAYDRSAMVHTMIEQQVRRSPEAIAVVAGDVELTYRELDARANRFAHALVEAGAGPDETVGIYMSRDVDLLIATLGCLKAGSAYVPLDPTYPVGRLEHMINDSGLRIIVSDKGQTPPVGAADGITVLDVASASAGRRGDAAPDSAVGPENLAYVIYTSGSTGRPKGVLVEHRNAVNFFAGMDERVLYQADEQPVWLAVTSLSFDISVLELFWTLANGFKVILYRGVKADGATEKPPVDKAMDFGLFYWGDDANPGAEKYKLLLDGARFADAHGFKAVWTPERHFHAFGGPYPNPAVTGAAVAAITENVEIRAGSCVLPLHHPARVAEDWAIVDNLSNGRAALAFASGWMPEDFILRPENAPPNNKSAMLRDIGVVQKLWRGEAVEFPAADGRSLEVTTLPRPVQAELPTWVTTAGNPETFRQTAELGANLLTHLLGQSMSELAEKIQIYRTALAQAGHDPAAHKVTLMLHTLVGTDREAVKQRAREPMKQYLRSAAALIKQYAWAFPTFTKPEGAKQAMDIDLQTLSEEEMDAIVEFAFERYFNDSGLFGTVEDAVQRVEQLKAIGVDEIACLIDFGIPVEHVEEGFAPLAEVVAACGDAVRIEAPRAAAPTAVPSETIASLVARHGVTHLQCTPAMANLLLLDDDDARALGAIKNLYLGGEALPGTLLRKLREHTDVPIENMYGPTETTIWSSTAPAYDTDSDVPLGKPIANTQLYILDKDFDPVPVGYPGELFIAGDGVTRGYHARPELTAERFRDNPFVPGGRMYMTGDLVKYEPDGTLRFLGRTDHQVKVRGYRIELGEIETALAGHPDVEQAVVIARGGSADDARLIAYFRSPVRRPQDDDLREHLLKELPDFMVPAAYVTLDAFPLTPNGKIDRLALPDPELFAEQVAPEAYASPSNDVETAIATVFKDILGLARVGRNDNFFNVGGHSLLAVQAQRALKETVAASLTITDLYQFPTPAGLASHIGDGNESKSKLDKVASRAARRRNAVAGRRGVALNRQSA